VSGSGIDWAKGNMQVCTSLQTDNHASTPPLGFLQAGCPSCRPTNSIKAMKAKSRPSNHAQLSLSVGFLYPVDILLINCFSVYVYRPFCSLIAFSPHVM